MIKILYAVFIGYAMGELFKHSPSLTVAMLFFMLFLWKLEWNESLDKEKEIVICAAVRAKNGLVVRGHRHFDAMAALRYIPGYKEERPQQDDQGFVTSKNRYVTREEAFKIQKAAGIESHDSKVGGRGYRGGKLFSEDLY